MALIPCPGCKQKISDKSAACSHCGFSLKEGTSTSGESAEKIASQARLARLKLRNSLQMQAMSGIILFLLGFMLWYLVGKRGLSEPSHFFFLGLSILGGVWYLVTRVRLITFKKGR